MKRYVFLVVTKLLAEGSSGPRTPRLHLRCSVRTQRPAYRSMRRFPGLSHLPWSMRSGTSTPGTSSASNPQPSSLISTAKLRPVYCGLFGNYHFMPDDLARFSRSGVVRPKELAGPARQNVSNVQRTPGVRGGRSRNRASTPGASSTVRTKTRRTVVSYSAKAHWSLWRSTSRCVARHVTAFRSTM